MNLYITAGGNKMDRTLEHILSNVQKPARYTGGEYNAVVKDKRDVDIRYALCFPDTYEIGMSNLGCRILYGMMNERPDVWCERCFAPWGDMEAEMRREGLQRPPSWIFPMWQRKWSVWMA